MKKTKIHARVTIHEFIGTQLIARDASFTATLQEYVGYTSSTIRYEFRWTREEAEWKKEIVKHGEIDGGHMALQIEEIIEDCYIHAFCT